MKVGEILKKAAVALPGAARSTPMRDVRREATDYAAWHAQWAQARRAFRAAHGPSVRVPGPRQLGLPWPAPRNPGAEITLQTNDQE